MRTPLLIDTDMGVDDAIAVCLALVAPQLDTRAIVSVGGNVDLDQATRNIVRLLAALRLPGRPRVGRGLDQPGPLLDARWLFGDDGLGNTNMPDDPTAPPPDDFMQVYADTIDAHPGRLVVLAIGPLTNVAAFLRDEPQRAKKIHRLIVMGGAVWAPGNVESVAEFNFYRDADAAAAVLDSALDITVIPLDVTRNARLDESHRAIFEASAARCGPLLSAMLAHPMSHGREPPKGTFLIHDAIALGALLWPELFMRTRVALEIQAGSKVPGVTRPRRAQTAAHAHSVLLSLNEEVFLERLIDVLTHEHFHV